jgi:CubicO group peptidase (beta-lactamase class C family)
MKNIAAFVLASLLSLVLAVNGDGQETAAGPQPSDKVDDYIAKAMTKAGVKGLSLAIVDGGKVVKVKGYGFTDADGKTPVTPRTLFQAASTSKVVTVMGLLRLADQRRLSLDDDVNKTLTSWKVPENDFTKDEKVTLRRLMTHMAGVNVDGFYGYPRGEPLPSLVDILDGRKPANSAPIRVGSVPGTKTAYSGGGYTILQQWVIDVSGQPFEEYMKDNVFKKLGMVDSTFECPLPQSKWDVAAHGYGYAMPDGKSFPHAEMPWKWNNYPEMAAAGLWTTAGDLALFVIDIQDTYAGLSSKVFTKDMAEKMLTPVPGNKWKLGLGTVLRRPGEPSAEFLFSGTNCGFQCGSFGTVNTKQGCVIMYNKRAGEAFPEEIRDFIAKEYAWPK